MTFPASSDGWDGKEADGERMGKVRSLEGVALVWVLA